jgi:long-chain acyl-CoA synthetase
MEPSPKPADGDDCRPLGKKAATPDGRNEVLAQVAAELDTFPKYLLRNAERFGDLPAMRHKDFGIWQSWSWKEQLDEIRPFALGLKEMGVGHGDKVAVVGANPPRR